MRVQAERAFILHSRPYQESSAILELLTHEHGRVSVVARGARRAGRRRMPIAPFNELQVGFGGRGSLYSLYGLDVIGHHWLSGVHLYAGLYMNEISLRLLRPQDPHPALFGGYAAAIQVLATSGQGDTAAPATGVEPVLRRYEKLLLRESGYELVFDLDMESGEPVHAERHYQFVPEGGFVAAESSAATAALLVPGSALLRIAADDYREPEVRRLAKRIMRQALGPLLGERGLHSRTLFRES
jgi:DNA repair protein RecO (recombination protein O)